MIDQSMVASLGGQTGVLARTGYGEDRIAAWVRQPLLKGVRP